jgi:hypothetical protein
LFDNVKVIPETTVLRLAIALWLSRTGLFWQSLSAVAAVLHRQKFLCVQTKKTQGTRTTAANRFNQLVNVHLVKKTQIRFPIKKIEVATTLLPNAREK